VPRLYNCIRSIYISLVFSLRPMGVDCCDHCDLPDPHRGNPAYRRVLWAVLAINAVMFAVEIGAGLAAGSAALQADPSIFSAIRQTTQSACSWSGWLFAIAPWQRSPRVERWAYSVYG
jgi:hypothetical protein